MNREDVRPASGGRAYARPYLVSLEAKTLLSFVRRARHGTRTGETGPVPVVDRKKGEHPSREGVA